MGRTHRGARLLHSLPRLESPAPPVPPPHSLLPIIILQATTFLLRQLHIQDNHTCVPPRHDSSALAPAPALAS